MLRNEGHDKEYYFKVDHHYNYFGAYETYAKIVEKISEVSDYKITPLAKEEIDFVIEELKKIIKAHPCVDKVELLPFRKICQTKYDSMGIPFPFANLDEATKEDVNRLQKTLTLAD